VCGDSELCACRPSMRGRASTPAEQGRRANAGGSACRDGVARCQKEGAGLGFKGLTGRAGVLLYMVDCAFRVLQQAQPVHITRADASADGSLVTVHFRAGPFTPIHAIQARPALAAGAAWGHCGRVPDLHLVWVSFWFSNGSTADELDVGLALLGTFQRSQSVMKSRMGWCAACSRMVKPWCVSGGRTCSSAWSACRRSSGTPSRRAPALRGTRCWRTSRATGHGRRCPHLWRHHDCLVTARQPAWPATGSAAVQAGLPVLLLSPSCACHSAGCSWRIQLRLVHGCVQLERNM